MARSMMALVFLFPAVAIAADDLIKTELDKARAKHTEGLAAARAKLAAAMDTKLREVADKGDLDGAKEVKSQKEQFEKDRTLPKSSLLASARTDYESEVQAAREGLRKAIEKAKEDYTKALKLDEAEALAAELKQLARVAPGKADSAPAVNSNEDPGEVLQGGTRWVGTISQTHLENGKKVTRSTDYELQIKSRDAKEFTGIIAFANGANRGEVEGTVVKGIVTCILTKDLTGNLDKDAVQNTVFKGAVKDKKLTGTLTKKGDGNYSGTIKLKLAEE